MKTRWWVRFTFLLGMVLIAVSMLIPTFFNFNKESSYPIKSKINLGLDLQGGLYMVLGIDFNKVYKDEVTNYGRRIQSLLKDEATVSSTLGTANVAEITDPMFSILLDKESDMTKAVDLIKKFYPGYLRITGEEKNVLMFALSERTKVDIEKKSVTKSIEVIRNRIDEFGVTEPEIIAQGNDRIVIQLPGVKDIERAKSLIGKTAKLTFNIVNSDVSYATVQSWLEKAKKEGIIYKKGVRFSDYIEKLNKFLKNDIPKGYMLAFQKQVSNKGSKVDSMRPYVIETNVKLTGEGLQDARVSVDQQKNQPYVGLTFKTAGAKLFEQITGENVNKQMAIVLDGNVYSAPNIQTKISGGNAQITLGTGSYSKIMKEASDLALVLRAGALPVKLEFQEQRTVGPSLGHDSIEKAKYASLIGCAFVFLFILIYYRISGFIAAFTLTLNVVFVMACLVAFGATLTLPGIAGIALTVGMAVDANIIIYERIREEIRKGLSYYKAVEDGFENAFWTIIDANITTALAGICLLNFGTGPIKGFAVTLLIGIVTTVYTSYFVGRLIFDFYMNKVEGQDLSI